MAVVNGIELVTVTGPVTDDQGLLLNGILELRSSISYILSPTGLMFPTFHRVAVVNGAFSVGLVPATLLDEHWVWHCRFVSTDQTITSEFKIKVLGTGTATIASLTERTPTGTRAPDVYEGSIVADASSTSKGSIRLAGDLSGTAALPTLRAGSVTPAKFSVDVREYIEDIVGRLITSGDNTNVVYNDEQNRLVVNATGGGGTGGGSTPVPVPGSDPDLYQFSPSSGQPQPTEADPDLYVFPS